MANDIELPPDTLDKLKDANRKLGAVDVFINKAKIAGLDMSSQEKQVKENRDRIRKLRDGFYPGQAI